MEIGGEERKSGTYAFPLQRKNRQIAVGLLMYVCVLSKGLWQYKQNWKPKNIHVLVLISCSVCTCGLSSHGPLYFIIMHWNKSNKWLAYWSTARVRKDIPKPFNVMKVTFSIEWWTELHNHVSLLMLRLQEAFMLLRQGISDHDVYNHRAPWKTSL